MAVATADESPDVKAGFYAQFSGAVSSVEGWELQALTNLKELPDYDEIEHFGYGRRGGGWRGGIPSERGAPVDEKGEPVFHRVPESWATAKSDGERFR